MSTPSKKEVQKALAIVREMGFVMVNNEQEKHLLDLLRHTTYQGRNLVIDTAIAMRQTRPWVRETYPPKSNTETTYPASDLRFFNLHEGD